MTSVDPPKTYAVMVSSTFKELEAHRRAIIDALPGRRLLSIAMEHDAALADTDLIDASLAKVDEADAYIGLISYRYGQAPICAKRNPQLCSLTELEFRRALERNIPICLFIMSDDHHVPMRATREQTESDRQQRDAFLDFAKQGRIYAEFTSIDDLRVKVVHSLVDLRSALDRREAACAATTGKRPASASPNYASNIPIGVPRHFMGRDGALDDIAKALAGDTGRVAITALHGLRGVGKTTLAAAFAERHRAEYRATWWLRAQTEATLRADLVALGVRLGWVEPDAQEQPAVATVLERLRHEGEGILLVYDNAIGMDGLTPYLPRGGAARVLITSNAHNWRGLAEPVEIRLWPTAVGADYLIARTGRTSERAAAEALSDTLGGLPLAHEQAAAYCERLDVGFAEYARRFAAAPAKLLDDAKHTPKEHNDGQTVAKSFSLAIEAAAQLHPAAEPLIVHAALLAPEPIPLYLFSEGREALGEPLAGLLADDGLDEAVAALRAFALVDRESIPDERDPAITTDCIRLHRLVRQVAAGRCVAEGRDDRHHALIGALNAVYPNEVFREPATWPRARRLDALALEALTGDVATSPGVETSACRLLNGLASYRQSALAAYSDARPFLERALEINECAFGPDDPGTGVCLNNLAVLLRTQGDLAAARALLERALAIYERALGPEHPTTAASLNNLASVLQAQGDFADALPLRERALSICERALGADDLRTASSLNNLASLLQAQGDLIAARPLVERALAIREKALGPAHPLTATSLVNLASLLQAQGDLAGARPLFERAITIDERAYAPDHPEVATDLANLASLLQAQGDLIGARPLSERALEIRETALGPDHPETATSLVNVASMLQAQSDFAGARSLFERALTIFVQALGPEHPNTKNAAGWLAINLDALGEAARAAEVRAQYGV